MHYHRHAREPGRDPPQNARLRGMGVDDVVATTLHEARQPQQCRDVSRRVEVTNQTRLDVEHDPPSERLGVKLAFGSGLGAGEKLARESLAVDQRAREQRGLLGPAHDHAGDHEQDAQWAGRWGTAHACVTWTKRSGAR
jgi:hypothetical protein